MDPIIAQQYGWRAAQALEILRRLGPLTLRSLRDEMGLRSRQQTHQIAQRLHQGGLVFRRGNKLVPRNTA